jgi:hypothetical protein
MDYEDDINEGDRCRAWWAREVYAFFAEGLLSTGSLCLKGWSAQNGCKKIPLCVGRLAGYETTANAMTYGFITLALRQDLQDRIIEEVDGALPQRLKRAERM